MRLWLGKIWNYEYWPIWVFYIPIAPYIFYLGLKAKSLTFFTNINPFIKDSGIIRYSKHHMMLSIPSEIKPFEILLTPEKRDGSLHSLKFPLIIKPNMGERGKGVELIQNIHELNVYLERHTVEDLIIQEYVTLPYEAGIFYIRKPSEKSGYISSLTTKEFLTVTGDGQQTVKQLMSKTLRSALQIKNKPSQLLNQVPAKDQIINIETIGNHSRGTRFINSNSQISPKLTQVFDDIAQNIEGFYYGRFDVKYQNFDDLENGKNFKIVELNGINSEPTHIYDQSTGLINAYRDFYTHMKMMYVISEENLKNNHKRTDTLTFWKSIFFPKKIKHRNKKMTTI
jgi:hypothetical protein